MIPATHAIPVRRRSALPLQMLAGLMLGLLVGLERPSLGSKLQPFGTAFIQAVQMIVIPLIFSSVTPGVCRMGENARQLGRVAVVAFVWFYVATLFAVLVALGLDGLFHPGAGANLVATGKVPANLMLSVDWTKYLLDLIPTNIVAAMAAQHVLPTLVFAVLFGLGLAGWRKAMCRKRRWRPDEHGTEFFPSPSSLQLWERRTHSHTHASGSDPRQR